jgi:hypothetical protein
MADKTTAPQSASHEMYDGYPDDDEVFKRIWAKLRAKGVTPGPVAGSPEWIKLHPAPAGRKQHRQK